MPISLAVCKTRGWAERKARIGSFWKAVSAAKAPNAVADTYARQLSDKAKAVLTDVAAANEESARARCREIVIKVAREFEADLRKAQQSRGGLQKAIGKEELRSLVKKLSEDAARRLEEQVRKWGLSVEARDELLRDWKARSEEHAREAIARNDKLAREERLRALAEEEARQQKERAEPAAREERARQRERELERATRRSAKATKRGAR